jgi:hypothetical protein
MVRAISVRNTSTIRTVGAILVRNTSIVWAISVKNISTVEQVLVRNSSIVRAIFSKKYQYSKSVVSVPVSVRKIR